MRDEQGIGSVRLLVLGAFPLAGQAFLFRDNEPAVFFQEFVIGALLLLGYAVSFCLDAPTVLV